MTARGKSHDADFGGVDSPAGGAVADKTDGALGVEQRYGVAVTMDGQPVFEDEGRNAAVSKIFAFVGAFMD